MKTSEDFRQLEKETVNEAHQKAILPKGIKYLLLLFVLSSLSFLPSCAVEMRTPQPGITIEHHDRGRWHNREYRHNHRAEHHRNR